MSKLIKPVVKYYSHNQEAGIRIPVTGPEWFDLWTDTSAMKSSSWFSSMSNRFVEGNKAKLRVERLKTGMPTEMSSVLTARKCPTIVEYLSRCLVVKAPCDIDFAIADGSLYNLPYHDKVYELVPSDERFIMGYPHPKMQYTGKSKDFKDHLNIKIDTYIKLVCPPDVEVVFQQPLYHNPNAPFKVLLGTFAEPYKRYASLIWNVMVPESVGEFSIKKGDALFYAYFNHRVKFKHTQGDRQDFYKDTFYKPMSLLTDVLGKKP